MEEIKWKPVKGYEGFYSVSNTGRVYSIVRNQFLKPDLTKGYHRVTLSKSRATKRYPLHRIVASAFCEKINGNVVNHLDGNKLNNFAANLEWCTTSENEKHSHRVLGKIPAEDKMCLDTQTGIFFTSTSKAAECFGIRPGTLLSRLAKNKERRFLWV